VDSPYALMARVSRGSRGATALARRLSTATWQKGRARRQTPWLLETDDFSCTSVQ